MRKYFILISMVLSLSSCTVEDENYYRSNPKELQKAIKACPRHQPASLTCQQVHEIGIQMNSLAYQLQYNPQAFGNKILLLQQTIAHQQKALNKEPLKNAQAAAMKKSLQENKRELFSLMSVVKWMESPVS